MRITFGRRFRHGHWRVAHRSHAYQRLVQAGWHDANAAGGPTWDPRNALNRDGHFTGSPAQRIDHVLSWHALQVGAVQTVLTDEVVPVPGGRRVTPSDHAGVLAELV